MNRTNRRHYATLVALIATVAGASLAHADDAQPAVWTQKEVSFTYYGFTTKYTCDGLRDKVRGLLLKLGARKDDLKVQRTGCSSASGHPDPFPGVRIKASVLQPANADAEKPVQAQWQSLTFNASPAATLDRGDCELVEQLKQKVLPIFATRNVEIIPSCIPHQLPTAGTILKLDVLMAPPAEKVATK